MKKFLIAAAVVLSSGIWTSCTKEKNITPVFASQRGILSDKKDIQSAD